MGGERVGYPRAGEGDPHGKRGVPGSNTTLRELLFLVVVVAGVVLVVLVALLFFFFLLDFCVCELFFVQQVGRGEGE